MDTVPCICSYFALTIPTRNKEDCSKIGSVGKSFVEEISRISSTNPTLDNTKYGPRLTNSTGSQTLKSSQVRSQRAQPSLVIPCVCLSGEVQTSRAYFQHSGSECNMQKMYRHLRGASCDLNSSTSVLQSCNRSDPNFSTYRDLFEEGTHSHSGTKSVSATPPPPDPTPNESSPKPKAPKTTIPRLLPLRFFLAS